MRILVRFEEIRDSHSKSDFLVHERLAFRLSTDELAMNNAKQLALGIRWRERESMQPRFRLSASGARNNPKLYCLIARLL